MVYYRKDYYRPIHGFQTLEDNRHEENNRFPGSLQCLYLTNSPESVTVRCKVEDGNLLIYHVFNNTEVVYQKLEN